MCKLLHVTLFKRSLRKYCRKGEHLRCQIGQVAHHKDEASFNDLNVFGAPGDQAKQNSEQNPKKRTSKSHHEK